MNIKLSGIFLTLVLFTFGCTQDPKSDEAKVEDAREVAAVEETASTYSIDKDQSEVTWVGTKPTGRHDGKFPIKEGQLRANGSEIVGGTLVMDVSQLEVVDEEIEDEDREKLTGHLKSNDFFDVENYPEAKFEITEVKEYEQGDAAESTVDEDTEFRLSNPTHTITGNLTIRDVTKSITFPARVNLEEDQITAQAKFNIDRTDWGVSYGDETKVTDKAQDQFIYNKVNLGFDVQASK